MITTLLALSSVAQLVVSGGALLGKWEVRKAIPVREVEVLGRKLGGFTVVYTCTKEKPLSISLG